MNRREFLKVAGAAGMLPVFNIGCAGFGRWSGLRGGEKARIAIVGCGDWGGTLLKRAGAVGGCELVAVCEPDPNAMKNFWNKAAKTWKTEDLATAKTYAEPYLAPGKPVWLVGLSFARDTRRFVEGVVQRG